MIGGRLLLLAVLAHALATHSLAQEAAAPDVDRERSDNVEWLDEQSALQAEESAVAAPVSQVPEVGALELHKENGDGLQLGFVNLRRIMASVPQLTTLRARLDAEFAQQKLSLDKQAEEIQQIENQLADMPRGDEYSQLEKQVIAKRRTFARFNASFRDAYSVRRNEELATLQQLVVDEIVDLAKEQGYDVILNDTGVVYVSPDADLTQIVIERLDKQARQRQHDN